MFFNDVCELEQIAERLAKEAEVIPAPKDPLVNPTKEQVEQMCAACVAIDPTLKWVNEPDDGIVTITPLKVDWLRLLVRLRQAGIPDQAIRCLVFGTSVDGSVYIKLNL